MTATEHLTPAACEVAESLGIRLCPEPGTGRAWAAAVTLRDAATCERIVRAYLLPSGEWTTWARGPRFATLADLVREVATR